MGKNQLKTATAVIVGLLALVFAVQNTEVVDVRFLVWDLSMSRVILILLAVLAGFVLGFVVARISASR